MSTSPVIGHNEPCRTAVTAPEHPDVQAHTVTAPPVPAVARRRVYASIVLLVLILAEAAWISAIALGLVRIFEG